jgi:drug/metabolite transporter (DMT)-like permease
MVKLITVLLIGLFFESTGVVLLKKGITRIGPAQTMNAAEIARVAKTAIVDPMILSGVFFEALFFASLLFLMARSDISFLWPLTALSFVFATFAAIWFLHESVSPARWAGVILIVLGAGLISYSEHSKHLPLEGQTEARELREGEFHN